jgi:hypothetical protein
MVLGTEGSSRGVGAGAEVLSSSVLEEAFFFKVRLRWRADAAVLERAAAACEGPTPFGAAVGGASPGSSST